jgi:hypothetical protein
MPKQNTPLTPSTFSIRDFCSGHNISDPVDDFISLYITGKSPSVIIVAGKPIITVEDAGRWRARMSIHAALREGLNDD